MNLADIFQSGMILQRDKPVRIWGTAVPGAEITVSIQGNTAVASTNENARWEVILPPLTASRQETLCLRLDTQEIVLEDVAVGEVWAACGQSNMEFPLGYEKNRDTALDGITDSGMLRFYDVPKVAFDGQRQAFDFSEAGKWRKATVEDAPWFSAIGFYFGKELMMQYNVPVGIVGCNWGGTRSAVWMREESVEQAGAPWMETFRELSEGIDWDSFYEAQRENPTNDHGKILNPGNAMMLPETLTLEEFERETGVAGEALLRSVDILVPEKIPGSLYRHMVLRLAPFTLRGILWYQGESDEEHPEGGKCYSEMLKALIADWRQAWQEGSLPFLVMQLANFRQWLCFENYSFTEIRAAQAKAVEETENAWLCSNTDAGMEWDIHPKDKRTPAHRMALLATGHVYGETILCDAPKAVSMERDGNQIIIRFDHAPDGLTIREENGPIPLRVFDGETERPYRLALDGNALVLELEEVPQGTVSVEFAQDQWFVGNLYNSAGLPAFPFVLSEFEQE